MTATADIVTSEVDHALLVPNAALRFVPEKTGKPAASASDNRGITGALVPHRRRRGGSGGDESGAAVTAGSQQTLYVLDADGNPKAITVTVGETNGTMTAITGGALKPGMRVITGQLSGKAGVSGGKGGPAGSAGASRSGGRRGG
jgi:HlyD family secretion protein